MESSLGQARWNGEALALLEGASAGAANGTEQALWESWRVDRSEQARQRLLSLHLPYARVVAASYYAKRLNDEIEFGDYLQLASLGLIESIGRFDPEYGVQFKTFAARRMHGSILDGIERLTEKQQQIGARKRLEAQRAAVIKEAIAAEHGEPAQRSGEQVLKYVAEAGLAFALAWILDGTGMLDAGEKSETLPFYRSVELDQLRRRIVELVNALPAQERKVIQGHYFQHRPFEEIADDMGLTRGRISQVHRKALTRLQCSMRMQGDCDASW
jgi:RNA polymerase sigma factor for flagellar operon FliA